MPNELGEREEHSREQPVADQDVDEGPLARGEPENLSAGVTPRGDATLLYMPLLNGSLHVVLFPA
jgi:hypothetical protein